MSVNPLVEDLFRRQSARLTAIVVRIFGPRELALAEEVVQEALLRALQRWPLTGVPARPEAWLMEVARNAALDAVRRRRTHALLEGDVARAFERAAPPDAGAPAISDDELAMLFMTAHPALSRESQIALMLKAAAGLGVPEIARALLADE
nr:RNA polymerase subunit sigma [Acidobacteriota bacterium]